MMRYVLAACFAVVAQVAGAQCTDDVVTVSGDWGQAHFRVEVADDAAERAQGLMFVEQMPMLSGMLFVYDAPHSATFWMRNTLIPLDMLFAGPDGVILSLHENAIPHDETTIAGGEGVLAVLEINGGLSQRLGIEVGDVLQHPAFYGENILPCGEKVGS